MVGSALFLCVDMCACLPICVYLCICVSVCLCDSVCPCLIPHPSHALSFPAFDFPRNLCMHIWLKDTVFVPNSEKPMMVDRIIDAYPIQATGNPCDHHLHFRQQSHSECVESSMEAFESKHQDLARNIHHRDDHAKIDYLQRNLEQLIDNVPELKSLLATVELAKTFINAEERHGLLQWHEYQQAATLLRQHAGHGNEALLDVFKATFPAPQHPPMSLHKLGRIMDIIIGFLVDVELWSLPNMGAASFFAEAALLGRNFAKALRPMLRRWKKDTKHDRALLQQVSQSHYFCGFHDMWILEFVLKRSQGYIADSCTCWWEFPTPLLTSNACNHSLPWATPHTWCPSQTSGWSLALTISACLTPMDMSSVRTLCPIAKYIIQSWWTDDPQRSNLWTSHTLWNFTEGRFINLEYHSIWNITEGRNRSPGDQFALEPHAYVRPQMLIDRLPLDMTAQELNEIGSDYGKACSARLWAEKHCMVGIIEYEREEDFAKAINDLDGRNIQDWPLKLKCSRWPTARRRIEYEV